MPINEHRMRTAARLAGSLLFGMSCLCQTNAAQPAASEKPQFEVASVKPNTAGNNLVMIRPPVGGRFTATNARLKMLVAIAYNVKNFEISGGPGWAETEGFDIEAKAADTNVNIEGLRPLLQSLLEDRFQLKVHRETRDVPLYALTIAKGGAKLKEAKEGGCTQMDPTKPPPPPPGPGVGRPPTPCGAFFLGPTMLHGGNIPMGRFATALSGLFERPVVDRTELGGLYDIDLEFSPEGTAMAGVRLPNDVESSAPSIFTVLQEQLGLKLESQKGPEQVIVIDHAEKPSEN